MSTLKKRTRKMKKKGRIFGDKSRSLRDLKAFGLWKDRGDVANPVEFTEAIRKRMEQGGVERRSGTH
jgi:hypothetical protein